MGRRGEQRLVVTLPVKISGRDIHNNPFTQDCETVDISRTGCRLRWISCLRGAGDTVELQYGKEKARFRVRWIGESGTRREGHVGLRLLDNKYIWGIALASPKPDEYALPAEVTAKAASTPARVAALPIKLEPSWTGEERRASRRYRCPGDVEVSDLQTSTSVRGMLSDISLGGCYVDTLSPFASHTEVQVRIKTPETTIESRALVRASHPSMGMGLRFTEMNPENRQRLETLVGQLAGQFAREVAAPVAVEVDRYSLSESDLSAVPVAEPAPAEPTPVPAPALDNQTALDTLLRLLDAKGIIRRDEFLEALEKATAKSGPQQ